MPTPAIKICGIRTPAALEATVRARATHLGLNFFPKSPRFVTPTQAAQLCEQAGERIVRVGLFVDASDDVLGEYLAAARLDALQLHGAETPERAAHLRARFGVPVWKVLSVATAADVARASAYAEAADFILFDAKTPKGTLPGGMGLSFDWSLVAGWKGPLAWGLAGGLDSANVAEAIRLTGTSLVDTSSGVESAPGVKDEARITAFCRAVQSTA
jgi:phosphoribosylanthranilate isomerase